MDPDTIPAWTIYTDYTATHPQTFTTEPGGDLATTIHTMQQYRRDARMHTHIHARRTGIEPHAYTPEDIIVAKGAYSYPPRLHPSTLHNEAPTNTVVLTEIYSDDMESSEVEWNHLLPAHVPLTLMFLGIYTSIIQDGGITVQRDSSIICRITCVNERKNPIMLPILLSIKDIGDTTAPIEAAIAQALDEHPHMTQHQRIACKRDTGSYIHPTLFDTIRDSYLIT